MPFKVKGFTTQTIEEFEATIKDFELFNTFVWTTNDCFCTVRLVYKNNYEIDLTDSSKLTILSGSSTRGEDKKVEKFMFSWTENGINFWINDKSFRINFNKKKDS